VIYNIKDISLKQIPYHLIGWDLGGVRDPSLP